VLSELGDDNEIDSHVYVGDGRGVTIGSHCQINSGCRLSRVVVADHVMIGPEVIVVGRLHRVDDVDIPMADQGEYTKPHTRIESDVWVGVRAIIMPGVTIGTGSIVGAGAVVTRDVAPWTVVGGAPARVIRERRPART
jgi:maltose O-acetyltransferase